VLKKGLARQVTHAPLRHARCSTEDAIKIKEMERRRGLPLERPPEAGDA